MALRNLRLGQKQEKNKGEVKGKAESTKKIMAWHCESHVTAQWMVRHGMAKSRKK